MREKIKSMDLRYKIIIVVGITVISIVGIFSGIISRTYDKYEEEVFGQESLNTLHSLDTTIQSMINSADNYSKMLIADGTVQNQMATGNLNSNTKGQQQVINKAYSILQFSETTDGIWFIDLCGQKLQIGGYASISAETKDRKYEELKTPYGKSKVLIESGKNKSFMTLVRSYNSTVDFSSIGIIGIEISEKNFKDVVSSTVDLSREKLIVLNENNQIIFWNIEDGRIADYITLYTEDEFKGGDIFKHVDVNGEDMLLSGIQCTQKGWKIIRLTPLPLSVNSDSLFRINLTMVIIIGCIMFLSGYFLTEIFTKPINIMLNAMKAREDGTPEAITEDSQLEEFRRLFKGYNKMVGRIDQLFAETIERQARIRQVELNEIQEQMKPHFLYNTLDSIEALAMMGDTETVCKLIEALGGFYRKSVSGGREFLTIKEEMEMAKDYAEIMHIRFGETFKCSITHDEACENFLIPKLTIQPLVENAFQHGIRGSVAYGFVRVSASFEENVVHIVVDDNGSGIPEEVVKELEGNIEVGDKSSLGLRGTIKRLRLVYGDAFGYEIGKQGASRIHIWIESSALSEKCYE